MLGQQAPSGRQDLYEVLALQRSATPEQIKTAYRKAALRYHPDKNSGTNSEQAAKSFQEVSAAYAILSDSSKRRKYDQQGFSGIDAAEVDLQVDVTSLGLFSTVAASLFTNLGVQVKTTLPQAVLETAATGAFKAAPLQMGQSLEGKVDKAQASFYEIVISQSDIAQGFIVGAYSTAGHRIKLLLFEAAGRQSWELQEQENSCPTQRGPSLAGLFFLHDKTYAIGPGKGGPEAKMNAENQLFQKLDTMAPREHISIQPGKMLVAVYNDNWFKKAQFKICAFLSKTNQTKEIALSEVQELEAKLLNIQSSVSLFQKDYLKAQEEWRKATERFDSIKLEMNQTLMQRDDAYMRLFGASQPEAASKSAILPSWGVQR